MVDDKTKLKSTIIYADGTFSHIEGPVEITVTDELLGSEEKYYEFYVRPTLKTRIKWKIKDNDPDFINTGVYAGFYKKKYKKDYCQQLDVSTKPTWLLHCDYQGKFIDLFGGEKTIWLDKMKHLRKQNVVLRASINSLAFEMTKMMKDPIGYLKKYGKHVKTLLDDIGAPYAPPTPPGGGAPESGR